jgi:hypothetical protein
MFDTVPSSWVAEYQEAKRREQGLPPLVTNPYSVSATRPTFSHYVCASEGVRVRLLAGPFASEGEANRWIETVKSCLLDNELKAAAGTLRLTRLLSPVSSAPRGELNQLLGVDASI